MTKIILAAGFVTTLSLGVLSCGASEQTRDDILKLGGISSTGNKDDSNPETGKQDATPDSPQPTQGVVCENQIDLSGRHYELSAASAEKVTTCSADHLTASCLTGMVFYGKTELTLTYLTAEPTDGLTTVLGAYLMCGTNLSIWPNQVDGAAEVETENLKSSEDLEILTHQKFPVVFSLKK